MQGQASDLSASCLDFLAVSDLREPPQLIVITVIVVTLPVPMRVPRDAAYAPPRDRHGHRHRRNALPKRLPRQGDSHDTRDSGSRPFSRRCAGMAEAVFAARVKTRSDAPEYVLSSQAR